MALIPIILFFVFCVYRYGLGIPILFLYSSFIIIFGIIIDGAYTLDNYLMSYLFSNTLVLIGFSFVRELKMGFDVFQFATVRIDYTAIKISFWIILFVIFLHYSIVGIPFLSASYDSVRFLQAGSGYFGIPSRFASYMPSIMMLTLIFYLFGSAAPKWQVKLMTLVVLVVFLLQGHKSSVLQIVFLAVAAYPYCDNKDQLKNSFKWFFGFSLIAGYFLFTQLMTIQDLDFFKYLVSRFSTIMHASGEYLIGLDVTDFSLFMSNPVINDLSYPINKLFYSEYETINTQLSREIYGVADGGFSVPVTPGFYSYHYFAFGPYLEKLFSFLIGVFIGLIDHKCRLTVRPMVKVSYVFIGYWIYVGYTSGNLYYLIPNIIFCLAFFILLYSTIVGLLRTTKE